MTIPQRPTCFRLSHGAIVTPKQFAYSFWFKPFLRSLRFPFALLMIAEGTCQLAVLPKSLIIDGVIFLVYLIIRRQFIQTFTQTNAGKSWFRLPSVSSRIIPELGFSGTLRHTEGYCGSLRTRQDVGLFCFVVLVTTSGITTSGTAIGLYYYCGVLYYYYRHDDTGRTAEIRSTRKHL
ncbi:hypothetical protein V1509DRAFT_394376 [Lipomyces kononenkoae]